MAKMKWLWLFGLFVSASVQADEAPVGYVLRGSPNAQPYLVGYEGRYFECETRRSCKSLRSGVPFYTALGFERATELIDYVGHDEVLRECMLRNCTEQRSRDGGQDPGRVASREGS